MYGNVGREITKYTVIYGVYIKYTVLINPSYAFQMNHCKLISQGLMWVTISFAMQASVISHKQASLGCNQNM